MGVRLGSRSFPADPGALHEIRRCIREEAEAAALDSDVVTDLILAVSEACANSALHGQSEQMRVRWEFAGDRIEVDVEDEGAFYRELPVPSLHGDMTGGRGLRLMMALMDEFTIRHGTAAMPGTRVRLVKYAA